MESRNYDDYEYARRKAAFKREFLKRKKKKKWIHNGIVIAIRILIIVLAVIIGVRIVDSIIPKVNTEQKKESASDATTSNSETTVVSETETSSIDPLTLVSKDHAIEEEVTLNLTEISSTIYVDSTIVEPLNSMLQDAKEAGYSLLLVSGYRTSERQQTIYDTLVESYQKDGTSSKKAKKKAEQVEQEAGQSEYQLGLAVDIVSEDHPVKDQAFADTDASKWLVKHCAEYGFILRYPKEKEDVTGMEYQPYHFRYVGTKAAKSIMENDSTLEEYIKSNS